MDLTAVFGRSPRILILEDDGLTRDLLKTTLTSSGCKVIAVEDGTRALSSAKEHPPDLALLDIRRDGLTTCKKLKTLPETRFSPIVIILEFDTEREKVEAIEAGADDFIRKSFGPLAFLARIRSLLWIKKLHDQLEDRNRILRRVLDHYVDEEIAEVILNDPEHQLRLGGETRKVTVLFLDIRGFSRYTENLPAHKVIETLNRIFEPLSKLVYAYRGTFDKYLGDGLMAFYGAPVSGKDDAQRAIDTAIAMQHIFSLQREEAGGAMAELTLGIGLHTGEAVVGNIGSDSAMDYTVVGDVVNVAKRLQEAAKGGEILISEVTYREASDVMASQQDAIQLQGRRGMITPYRVTLAEREAGEHVPGLGQDAHDRSGDSVV
jgi:class 3 adenylate cyclase/CheY-like chemotaxis protein